MPVPFASGPCFIVCGCKTDTKSAVRTCAAAHTAEAAHQFGALSLFRSIPYTPQACQRNPCPVAHFPLYFSYELMNSTKVTNLSFDMKHHLQWQH